MPILGRKWPVPVWQPMWPFYAAGLIVLYGVNTFGSVMMKSDEYKDDPRNPYRKSVKPIDKQ